MAQDRDRRSGEDHGDDRGIERMIREAHAAGAFDNLPGKGKPIQWEDDSLVPEDQRLAHHLLKHNGYTLDWIEDGKEFDRLYEAQVRKLDLARQARAGGRLDLAGWKAAAAEYVKEIRAINLRIIGYNMRVPSPQLERRPYPIDPDFV